MKRHGKAVFYVVMVLLLAAMPACDSSSSGGGTTPAAGGYSMADLAGVWAVRFSSGEYGLLGIQEDGQVSLFRLNGVAYSNGMVFRVEPDGTVTTKGWWRPVAVASSYFHFHGKFINKLYVVGTLNRTYPIKDTYQMSMRKKQ